MARTTDSRTTGRARGRLALCAILCAPLVGCAGSVRTVGVHVSDASTGEPVPAAHVRFVSLQAGMVPLPINQSTVSELLAAGDERTGGFTDRLGVARVRVRSDVAHVVRVEANALRPTFDDDEQAAAVFWVLERDGVTLTRIDRESKRSIPDDTPDDRPYSVRIIR